MFDPVRDSPTTAPVRPATSAANTDPVVRASVHALSPARGRIVGGGLDADKRTLLTLMAGGAVDGQVARSLGVSVRTVRRRISALLVELGAHSRFQAGAEAVRRGWI